MLLSIDDVRREIDEIFGLDEAEDEEEGEEEEKKEKGGKKEEEDQ